MHQQHPSPRQHARIARKRLARHQVNGHCVRRKRIKREQVKRRAGLRRKREARVTDHNLALWQAPPQIGKARARNLRNRRINLENPPVLAWSRITGERASPQPHNADPRTVAKQPGRRHHCLTHPRSGDIIGRRHHFARG